MPSPKPKQPVTGEVILYATADGRNRLECRFAGESVWLKQALMAELFGKNVRTINEHLRNLYTDGELDPEATIRKFRIVRAEGVRDFARLIEHYSLEAILAVGYRVRSPRGLQFRRWATERLSDYPAKGFTMDDQRLSNPPVEGSGVPDYFDELLERIRDIRASERRMCLRVRENFTLAADYHASSAESAWMRSPSRSTPRFAPHHLPGRVAKRDATASTCDAAPPISSAPWNRRPAAISPTPLQIGRRSNSQR
jgi:hypothetical protein